MATKRKTSTRARRPSAAPRRGRKTAIGRRQDPAVIPLRQILVPIDFSDSSKRALHYAGLLAVKFGARMVPLHVVEPVIYPSDMAFAPMAAELPTKISVAATKRKLELWCAGILPTGALDKPIIRIGQPFHEIATAAKELEVDLIVISTHGYTGLRHVLLGSTAERVIRHAPCPVLTVRRP